MPSLSTAKPSVAITMDVVRQIRFDWKSAYYFEERYGKTIPQALQQDQIGIRLITHLAWAGMIFKEPALTIDNTIARVQGFLNNGGEITELATALMGALVESGVIGRPKGLAPEADPVGNDPALPPSE